MLVIEGPDGSGKSSLVRKISKYFDIPIHERASDSVKGPVPNLMGWAYEDVISQPSQPLAVYDRHPLISEYIYAPVCRELRPEFVTSAAHNLIRLCARQTFVVWCDPGYSDVFHNVGRKNVDQMPGVVDNAHSIYNLYLSMRMFWPGQSTVYNYVRHDENSLFGRLVHHVASFNMIRRNDDV